MYGLGNDIHKVHSALEKRQRGSKEYTNDEKEVMKLQYDKLTENWRHFNDIIWQVPTVAVAIMTGVIVAAYSPYLEGSPRIAALGVGSLFLFALTIEIIKKREHMNAISFLLKDLQVGLGMPAEFRFPLGTKFAEIKHTIDKSVELGKENQDYFKQPPLDSADRLFKIFQGFYARKSLTYVIFIAAIVVATLFVIELVCTISKDIIHN
jgi:hypothetical protein